MPSCQPASCIPNILDLAHLRVSQGKRGELCFAAIASIKIGMNPFSNRQQYLVRLAYFGDKFFGVQEQPGLDTVLGALRKRIETKVSQRAGSLAISARTDRGVHARENFATFYVRPPVDDKTFIAQVESDHHDNLHAVSMVRVPDDFHARGQALCKVYRYSIIDSSSDMTQLSAYAWRIVPSLSMSAMREAAKYFIGSMDFSSLRGGGCQAGSPIKEITAIEITRTRSGYVIVDIFGRSFVRNMVRNLMGLLVEVGAGLRDPHDMPTILAYKSRTMAGIMVPAHGLCLYKVEFDMPPRMRVGKSDLLAKNIRNLIGY